MASNLSPAQAQSLPSAATMAAVATVAVASLTTVVNTVAAGVVASTSTHASGTLTLFNPAGGVIAQVPALVAPGDGDGSSTPVPLTGNALLAYDLSISAVAAFFFGAIPPGTVIPTTPTVIVPNSLGFASGSLFGYQPNNGSYLVQDERVYRITAIVNLATTGQDGARPAGPRVGCAWNYNGGTDRAVYVTTSDTDTTLTFIEVVYLPAYNSSYFFLFADVETTAQGGTIVIERIA